MGKKRINKTKEQLIADLKKNEEFQKKMKFTREVFYPSLCEASKSVEDAMSFLGSLNTVMMEIFLGLMKEKKLGELNLKSKLDPKDEKYEELCTMINLFEDMSIFEAKSYFEGMKGEIQLFINDEQKDRPLSDLKTRWIDQLEN